MVRVALIGLGKMGLSHHAIVHAHPDVECVGVCDSTAYMLDILNKYTGVKTYSDYIKLLDEQKPEAVVIATPSKVHGQMVKAALDRNIHVFCEKPFCLDWEEGQKLAELAERKGLVNQVGYHYRFVAAFEEMKRLVNLDAIGQIHHIRAEAYGPVVLRPKGSTWRTAKSEGGGCLYDYACHGIDLVNYILGRPDAVAGTVLNSIFSRDVEDEVYATFYYNDGKTGQISANWSDESYRKMSTKISIWGTKGKMVADRQEVQIYLREASDAALGLTQGWNTRYTTDLTKETWYYLRGEEYSEQIDHFIQSIKTRSLNTRSTFRSATDTDFVVNLMLKDANSARVNIPSPSSGGLSSTQKPAGILNSIKNLMR
jgi:scyllo-inositol 2-dehydrogenase (NADP+)